MIEKLVDFALKNRFLVLGSVVMLLVWGGISFHNLPIDAYPDVADNYVNIITQWPGHSAEDIEKQITVPCEIAMAGIPDMKNLRSFSLAGISSIMMNFNDDSSNSWNRERVLERLSGITLPANLQPQLQTDWSPAGQIYWYTIESKNPNIDVMEQKSLEDWVLQKQFKNVPGVVDVASFGGITKTIDAWADSMIVASNNDATTALVSLLHHGEFIVRQGETEINHLNALFAHYGLTTLKLSNTRANGGWRSADGAGVGNIHMTAWDTVRLLWLLSDAGPKAPWLAPEVEPILSKEGKHRIWGYLGLQGLHTILSSTSLAGVDGWQAGIPAHLSERWIQSDGSVLVEDIPLPADVRPANSAADVYFAHKTGNTENYCSDAGLVRSFNSNGRRYIIALLSNLGTRYQANPYCSSTWRIPALGQAIDQWIAQQVE